MEARGQDEKPAKQSGGDNEYVEYRAHMRNAGLLALTVTPKKFLPFLESFSVTSKSINHRLYYTMYISHINSLKAYSVAKWWQ